MLEKLRLLLARPNANIWQLTLLGMMAGIFAGGVIVLFRLVVELAQMSFLPEANAENYEALPVWALFTLPLVGGILLGLLFQLIDPRYRSVGPVHTIERLDYHQGHLPFGNMVTQFVGAAISIVSGHSVGREGPSVHLGAASGSLLGQGLTLPHNSIRTLVACGIAAGIAASFNTPLAGVIFTIEVIMLEYTFASMLPILLAAVSATVLSQAVFGHEAMFTVPAFEIASSVELLWIVLTGLCIGALAASYNYLLLYFTQVKTGWPVAARMSLAGFLVGLCALATPEIMSIGYDTVAGAVLGNLGFAALAAIVFFKILATTAGIGLGLPGGLIGPTVFIGATAGAAVGMFALYMNPDTVSHPGLFAMVGMAAMMGATLQAPVAALMAIFELTLDPYLLLPGMLAIVVANLTASAFKQKSIFVDLLRARGLDYRNDPVSQALRNIGITSVVSRDFVSLGETCARAQAEAAVKMNMRWILVESEDPVRKSLPTLDLARFLEEHAEAETINLREIPANRRDTFPIASQASLQDAYELFQNSQAEAVYVERSWGGNVKHIYGIMTRDELETHQKGRRPV